jgi:hypothetical protein
MIAGSITGECSAYYLRKLILRRLPAAKHNVRHQGVFYVQYKRLKR